MFCSICVMSVVVTTTNESATEIKNGATTIRITKKSFSPIYPAVWFSPSTGKITPLAERSEKPPKAIYKIWIEPNDPEISTLDRNAAVKGVQGFQLIGYGKRLFKNPVLPDKRELTHKLRGPDLAKPFAVFLFADGKRSYVMFIESFSKKNQELIFKWKALQEEQ